jgi:hypothetical protein
MEKALTKVEIKKMIDSAVKEESDKIAKNSLSTKDIEEILRGFMKNYHKILWQKSSSFINQVKS